MSNLDTNRDDWLVRTVLEDWNEADRPLPWRSIRDPWLILVSELMSQQTQMARVVPSWERFVAEFPDPASVARSTPARVVELWAGLGYNRRAIHLHQCATMIVEVHRGAVPDTLDDLMALPGVGPYTARAVMAFAFESDVGVLDTNVGRILARFDGTTYAPVDAQRRADALVPAGDAWRWNQALLDLGAGTCVKRAPKCEACAVRARCAWAGEGADPAIRSAGVSASQSRFVGSDRQGRGRLISALREHPIHRNDLAKTMGWPDDVDRAEAVAAGIVRDGLANIIDDRYVLPGSAVTGETGHIVRSVQNVCPSVDGNKAISC
ncbi:MAG: A/G-specific adenine glycosylase [Acidimicrobiales bacterium]|nr:A/G-specific adenine glycosylase [Acidimicrobiales bacterium]RZV48542.1 MAG: A/G-specific adenine glycosylase [Acidimicrobiales bacterium]